MSLTSAAMQAHSHLQKLVPQPYHINLQTQLLVKSSKYSTPLHNLYRKSSQIGIFVVLLPFVIFRLVWLFANWNAYSRYQVVQVIVYSAMTNIILIYLPVSHMLHKHADTMIQINQMYALNIIYKNSIHSRCKIRIPIIGKFAPNEIFVYGLSLLFLVFTLMSLSCPFCFTYMPAQLIFGDNFIVRMLSAISYGLLTLYGSLTVLSVLLIAIIFLENLSHYTSTMYYSCTIFPTHKTQFYKYYLRFRNAQICLMTGNSIYNFFLKCFVFLGILLNSCCTSLSITMYGKINFFVYLTILAVPMICFTILFLFPYLANIPFKHSIQFKIFWSRFLLKNEQRKQLMACRPFGLDLGPYGICTMKHGLLICDDVIQNTVTLLLLGVQ